MNKITERRLKKVVKNLNECREIIKKTLPFDGLVKREINGEISIVRAYVTDLMKYWDLWYPE